LLARGFHVIGLARHDVRAPGKGNSGLIWTSMNDLVSTIERLDVPEVTLLSCGPIALAQQVLEKVDKLSHAVVISTSSVIVKADSPDPLERKLIETIAQAEQEISGDCESAGITLTTLRPTLIFGCGKDDNISFVYRWARRFRFFPVAGSAPGLRQPLHADDLAEVAIAALNMRLEVTSPVCGGSTISYHEMISRVLAVAGNSCRVLPVPAKPFTFFCALVSGVSGSSRVRPEMVKRQARDLVFDDSALRRATGVPARKFHPAKADFEIDGGSVS
jgi:nucleoside-diphosphate-sugar epimerase